MKSRAYIITLCTLLASTQAWNRESHFLIARLAYDILIQESPDALSRANDLLAVAREMNATFNPEETRFYFVECANWADEIRSKDGKWNSPWHINHQPYFNEGGSLEDFPDFKFNLENTTHAIQGIIAWLREDPGY